MEELIGKWFQCWESGELGNLPVAEGFKHISPYGTIDGKRSYMALVEANKDKFLGHRSDIHDTLYDKDKAVIRYTAIQENFELEVSEWHFVKDGLIEKIIAYYNIPGEIREDRKLEISTSEIEGASQEIQRLGE